MRDINVLLYVVIVNILNLCNELALCAVRQDIVMIYAALFIYYLTPFLPLKVYDFICMLQLLKLLQALLFFNLLLSFCYIIFILYEEHA